MVSLFKGKGKGKGTESSRLHVHVPPGRNETEAGESGRRQSGILTLFISLHQPLLFPLLCCLLSSSSSCPSLLLLLYITRIHIPNPKSNYAHHVILLYLKTLTPLSFSPILTLMTISHCVVPARNATCSRLSNSNPSIWYPILT